MHFNTSVALDVINIRMHRLCQYFAPVNNVIITVSFMNEHLPQMTEKTERRDYALITMSNYTKCWQEKACLFEQ